MPVSRFIDGPFANLTVTYVTINYLAHWERSCILRTFKLSKLVCKGNLSRNHAGRKIRVDIQVFGLFVGLPAPCYIRRVIVAARLGPCSVNGASSFVQKRALYVASDSVALAQLPDRHAVRTHLRIDAGLLLKRERLFGEIEDSEDLSGTNIHCEVAAPRAARSTDQCADVRGSGDPSVMALLRTLERAEYSQVSDLVMCPCVLLL